MGVETVAASRYEVTTQERWLRPPRSPTIVGSAVETIVWSSAARNMPSISAPNTVLRARPPVRARGDDVLQPTVLCVQREHPLEEAAEASPRILLSQRLLGRADERRERIFEHGVDQILFGREVPVERAHPDGRAAGDL